MPGYVVSFHKSPCFNFFLLFLKGDDFEQEDDDGGGEEIENAPPDRDPEGENDDDGEEENDADRGGENTDDNILDEQTAENEVSFISKILLF